jgi:hypothetical protein
MEQEQYQHQRVGTVTISPSYYASTAAWVPNSHNDLSKLERMCTDDEWEKFSEELCLEKMEVEEHVW